VAVLAEFAIAVFHPPYNSFLEQWGSAVANAVIALGIVGEVLFSRKDARIQTELRKRSNGQLASAIESAAEAGARAAEANAKALEAQAELDRLKAPRLLSEEQRGRITEKMRQFADQEFTGAVTMGVSDAWTLWRLIANSLEGAGWVRASPSGQAFGDPPASIPITARTGVGVLTPVGGRDFTIERVRIGQALAEAIAAEGIDAIWSPVSGSAVQANPRAIRIEIGPKT
jgi:hypothetical protein